MCCIVFYEKPGCATNRLQKQLLRATGLQLEVKDLLSEPWTGERLRPFFADKPVSEWFNPSAPAIKYGEVDPATLSAEEAIELMLAQPLLIRRPLIRYGEHFMAGFDLPTLARNLPCGGKFPDLSASPSLDSCSIGQGTSVGCLPVKDEP